MCTMCGTVSDAELYWNASLNIDNRHMHKRREFYEIIDSSEICDIYSNSLTYLYSDSIT